MNLFARRSVILSTTLIAHLQKFPLLPLLLLALGTGGNGLLKCYQEERGVRAYIFKEKVG